MNEHDSRFHHRSGDFALDNPMNDSQPSGAAEPVDVAQVRADDALIAAVSTAVDVRVKDPIDEHLAELLQEWRDDVRIGSERPLVDIDTAAAVLASPPRARAPRRPTGPFGPLATAAAVLVVAFIGIGLAARGAEPGDTLWNVTKVLYSEKARSVEAKITVTKKLDEAREALESGNVTAAMFALQEAQKTLEVVKAEDGQEQLANETEQLIAELTAGPGVTVPPEPRTAVTTPSPSTTAPITPDPSTSPAVTTTVDPSTTEPTPPTTTTEQVPGGTPSTDPGGTSPAGAAPKGSAGAPTPTTGSSSDTG